MSVRVAVVGLGMMGTTHFKGYQAIPEAKVVAVCDVESRKRAGDWAAAAGNIDTGAAQRTDLSALKVYGSLARLLKDPDVDVVDLCVPTFRHASMAIAALRAGKHVLCEKPISLVSRQAQRMIKAADESGRMLAVGHVLRFWPEYVAMKQMIKDGRYGKVRSMWLGRFSARPGWSWDNWLQNSKRSGSAALDLHIHDADTALWFFGPPDAVSAAGTEDPGGGLGHITATYHYAGGPVVVAEGGWDYPAAFPFRMEARILFERAAVEYSSARTPTLTVYGETPGQVENPPVTQADGYTEELRYFIRCVSESRRPERLSPANALAAVRLVEAEVKAARRGRPVRVGA